MLSPPRSDLPSGTAEVGRCHGGKGLSKRACARIVLAHVDGAFLDSRELWSKVLDAAYCDVTVTVVDLTGKRSETATLQLGFRRERNTFPEPEG